MHSYLPALNTAMSFCLVFQKKPQRVQNAAARLLKNVGQFEHITPILFQLHWLPVAKHVEYKILLITYKILSGFAPEYLTDLVSV